MVDKQKIRDRIEELKFEISCNESDLKNLYISYPILFLIFFFYLENKEYENWFFVVGFVLIVFSLFLSFYNPNKNLKEKVRKNYQMLLDKKK